MAKPLNFTNEFSLDLETCKIIVYPHINKVIFICKWSAECHTYGVEEFCDILDKVAEKRRTKCSEEKRLLEEKHRLEETLNRLRHGKTEAKSL